MKFLILSSVLILIASCNSNNNFQDFIDEYPNSEDYFAYVIIPSIGCSGCISTAEIFLMDHYKKSKNIKFFIVSQSSKKALKIRFGNELIQSNNVEVIDHLSIGNDELIYPTVLYLNSNTLDSIANQSPWSNAVLNLKNYVR